MTQDAPTTVVHGIDFGTSTSMIVVGRPGVPQLVVKDPLAVRGEVGIPTSVCARPDGTLAVGFEAERIKQIHVADYRAGFKLDIGKPVIYRLGGADYSPADLMAEVIRFLRARALAVVPTEPSAVVLTVPVAWEDWTRDQAIEACVTAGYHLSLIRLETEPVAAMAGLGLLAGTTVIYDLGGGTFDCAVVVETDAGQEIYGPPGGLRHVGGRAFDDQVVRLMRERFPQAAKIFAPEAVPGDPARAGGPEPGAASAVIDLLRRRIQLREKCVEAKVELSLIQSTEKLLSELDPPELLILSRTELDGAISDLVEATVGECERMLTAVGLSFGGVDQILQIGGSSRIPLSGERLRVRSGRQVQLVEEPDLAVARGAAELALRIVLPPEPEPEPEPAPPPAVTLSSAVMPAEARPAEPHGLRQFNINRNPFTQRKPELRELRGGAVKIVMLGHSGAGKTTYLSLMYAEMQDGIGGFQVRAKNSSQHSQLLADARAIRSSRYPPATNRRASYDLALSYNSSEVLPFTWRDHRGGAASGRTSDAEDVGQLHKDLLESDAIVMFFDGRALVHDPVAARNASKLSSHVLRAMRDRPEIPTPLVVAVTKSDLIDVNDDKVGEKVFAPVAELVKAVAATQHIVGTLIPVACGPSPMNVVVPVLWSLRFGLLGMLIRLSAEVESSVQAANAAASRDTVIDRLVSWWRDESSYATIAENHRQVALRAHRQLQPLIKPAEGLEEMLKDIQYF